MREFVARENIKRFEGQLAACRDPGQREILWGLLQEARQQLAEAEADKRASG